MDLEEAPHEPNFLVGGVELDGEWIIDHHVTVEDIMEYCEHNVTSTEEWDLCVRLVICIEEYDLWWERVQREGKRLR